MESLEQGKTAVIADEYLSARGDRLDCAFEHVHQIINAREVLRDRVDDHGVETIVSDIFKVVARSLENTYLREPSLLRDTRKPGRGFLRKVGCNIAFAFRRNAQQEQSRPASDFEHTPGRKPTDSCQRVVHPLTHVFGRNGLGG